MLREDQDPNPYLAVGRRNLRKGKRGEVFRGRRERAKPVVIMRRHSIFEAGKKRVTEKRQSPNWRKNGVGGNLGTYARE